MGTNGTNSNEEIMPIMRLRPELEETCSTLCREMSSINEIFTSRIAQAFTEVNWEQWIEYDMSSLAFALSLLLAHRRCLAPCNLLLVVAKSCGSINNAEEQTRKSTKESERTPYLSASGKTKDRERGGIRSFLRSSFCFALEIC